MGGGVLVFVLDGFVHYLGPKRYLSRAINPKLGGSSERWST